MRGWRSSTILSAAIGDHVSSDSCAEGNEVQNWGGAGCWYDRNAGMFGHLGTKPRRGSISAVRGGFPAASHAAVSAQFAETHILILAMAETHKWCTVG